jgi:hypothetical protein
VEKHFLVDGQPVSGGLFDFGLYFFHNAMAALERGTGRQLAMVGRVCSSGKLLEGAFAEKRDRVWTGR